MKIARIVDLPVAPSPDPRMPPDPMRLEPRVSRNVGFPAWAGMLLAALLAVRGAEPVTFDVRDAAIEGKLDGDTARLVIQANLGSAGVSREPAILGTTLQHRLKVGHDRVQHEMTVRMEAIRGVLREVMLPLSGMGDVRDVIGEGLESWAVRQGTNGARALVLRIGPAEPARVTFTAKIRAETSIANLPAVVSPLTLSAEQPAMGHGFVLIETSPDLEARLEGSSGVVPIDATFLPQDFRPAGGTNATAIALRFQGEAYSVPLRVAIADPEARRVVLTNFSLEGNLAETGSSFTLKGVARVRNPQGGRLELLSGAAALIEAPTNKDWTLEYDQGRFIAVFEHAGEFPVLLKFQAGVQQSEGWSRADFRVATAAVSPVSLTGLGADTQLTIEEASRPERAGDRYEAKLPANGRVRLAWRPARSDVEGRMFFAAEAVIQVAVSPGLLRQTALFDLKVMQGELSRVTLRLQGDGEVTRVQGAQVLAWSIEPMAGGADRALTIQFNQPQHDQASFQVELQRSLGAFPLATDVARWVPEEATRFAGYLRIVNEGAVRLEVLQASGLSQISPEQFIQTDATRTLLPAQSTQIFAYRFAGPGTALRIQADNILPELAVSQVLVHRLGETELSIDAELEIDVREAPLRELVLRVPKGYSLARLQASGLSDSFLTEPPESSQAQLRLIYGTPVSGRQLVELRLERNQSQPESRWSLPRIDVDRAKSVRGHVGVLADAGFRLTPGATSGLAELATGFFPKKIPGLQWAYRVVDPDWDATLTVERLAQTIQADAFHLFSVGEGIAYGSSLLNFLVTGAPVSVLRIELSGEYFNVEFTGQNIRNWQKTALGYEVQLHTPVAGAYTLLATYERPFRARGETLTFTGARPIDAQSEQGYTLVVSTFQFQVRPVTVSPTLASLEPGEVPAEYRLFFDAPILAAYRYTARPFNLQLELNPLAQGEVVSQVIDRAALVTRISEEGQVVTDARYFVKAKGAPHLRIQLPEGDELWAATVNGSAVVPVQDGAANLIPMAHSSDPDVVMELHLKTASRARGSSRLTLSAPIVAAPVLLAEWKLEPAEGRRLVYRHGTLIPADGVPDRSGFATLARLLDSPMRGALLAWAVIGCASTLVGALVWSGAFVTSAPRFRVRHLAGGVIACVATLVAVVSVLQMRELAASMQVPPSSALRFVAPVQHAGVAWTVQVSNLPLTAMGIGPWFSILLTLISLVVWSAGWLTEQRWRRRCWFACAWTLLSWAVLRLEGGAPAFFYVLLTFLAVHLLLPAMTRWWRRGPDGTPVPLAAAATVLLTMLCGLASDAKAGESPAGSQDADAAPVVDAAPSIVPARAPRAPLPGDARADLVLHELRVENDHVFGTSILRWRAKQGELLPLVQEPGILMHSGHDPLLARLLALRRQTRMEVLAAETNAILEFPIVFQTRVQTRGNERGFILPVPSGLANRARLSLPGQDVEVTSPQAVSMTPVEGNAETNTLVDMVLAPAGETWIAWKPRSRDTRRERAVFYAEWSHLLIPGPGIIEGRHEVHLRPAQGELDELIFDVPAEATITDVTSPALAFWRFDPDAKRLRVSLSPAQSRSFTVVIHSQVNTGSLPFERTLSLPRIQGAAGEVGLLGVATGNEVQLEDVQAPGVAAINLEDFPIDGMQSLKDSMPELTVRRAFRYAGDVRFTLKAASVEPDVRVETQQTLSLGEDRTVLGTALTIEVLRAGIFKLSFDLPGALEVETVSGPELSHWTEVRADGRRTITLHLKGKTLGQHPFNLTLAGPGVRSTNGWVVPRLTLHEASRQRGQLIVVPEQGLRVQVARREGATQLDPVQAGVRQKGVLAFRLLQDPWLLALDLERVDAWLEVTGLQHFSFDDAQVKVVANLQYEVENTGVKSLVVGLPAGADNVRFRGDMISDFLALTTATEGGLKDWEVKLDRRLIGHYVLQVAYTIPLPSLATNAVMNGLQARGVNLQRGFVALRASGRLQIVADPPPALQPTEWQVIPRALLQDLPEPAASYTFRLVEPAFELPVRFNRHEAARLLPARVNSIALTSVVADDAAMLTQVRIELIPGDKRLLHLTLPPQAKFWFAFVNEKSVWPWQSTNEWLLPLEHAAREGEATSVEFFFSSAIGKPGGRSLDLDLVGPRFDLPLENITWNVFLNDKWRVRDWSGTLRLQEQQPDAQPAVVDLNSYIQGEVRIRRQKTADAEKFLSLANTLVEQGDTQEARRAFQAAYGMSRHDQAFNEDARVQLNNLRTQQAIVGLNVRQARVAGRSGTLETTPREIRENQAANYTQSEAKQLLGRNSVEENEVQSRLAERLIQQQDAAVANPAAIRAAIPEHGRRLTFTRSLDVNTWSDLRIHLETTAATGVSGWRRLGILILLFAGMGMLLAVAGPRRRSEAA